MLLGAKVRRNERNTKYIENLVALEALENLERLERLRRIAAAARKASYSRGDHSGLLIRLPLDGRKARRRSVCVKRDPVRIVFSP